MPVPSERTVTSASRFFRVIASVYELHAEVAEIALDETARRRLAAELRFLRETLREALSAQVFGELTRLDSPPGPDLGQDELRIACSELLGWLIALLPEAERVAARARRSARDGADEAAAGGVEDPPEPSGRGEGRGGAADGT
jgi:hypothetical protein